MTVVERKPWLAAHPSAHRLGFAALHAVILNKAMSLVAALMGVAGGELLIPTIVLLHASHVKLAGSLSLAVSLPTMIVAFARYSRDRSFAVLRTHRGFALLTAAGSVVGTVVGGLLVGVVPTGFIVPLLVLLLLVSAEGLPAWSRRSAARPALVRRQNLTGPTRHAHFRRC